MKHLGFQVVELKTWTSYFPSNTSASARCHLDELRKMSLLISFPSVKVWLNSLTPNIQYIRVKLHIPLHKKWGKVEFKRNNSGIDELKAGDVTNNIFGTEHHCWSHRPGRAPPQRSLFCWDLSCGHIRSAQQHHILSWVYGAEGQRAHGHVSVVKQIINKSRESHASLKHWWFIPDLKISIETTEYWLKKSAQRITFKNLEMSSRSAPAVPSPWSHRGF